MVFYSTRLEMESMFRKWCDDASEKFRVSVPPSLNGMLTWLEEREYLNEEKIKKDFPLKVFKEETSK